MKTMIAKSTATVLVLGTLAACGKSGPAPVVVADTSAVARAGAVVLSGKPSLESAVVRDAFLPYAGGGRIVEFADDAPDRAGGTVAREFDSKSSANLGERPPMELCPGDPAPVAAALGRAGAAWLGDRPGGELADCVLGTAELVDAIGRLRSSGGAIGGGAGGAAVLGKWIVPSVASAEAIALGFPRDPVRGLGVADEFVVCPGIFENAALGALVMTMAETKSTWGLGLDGGGGVAIDAERKRMKIVGDGPVLLVDLREAKTHGGRRSVENARLSLLCPGDSFALDARQVRFVAAKTRTGGPPAGGFAVQDPGETWTEASLRGMIARLANARSGSSAAPSRHAGIEHRLTVSVDERTQSFEALAPDSVPETTRHTIVNLRLDIAPTVR